MNKSEDSVIFADIDFSHPSILDKTEYKQRRTPIIGTLTDTKITPVDIQKMMEAGMNVARFKMSHSTKGDKMRLLGKVDKAALNCCKKHVLGDWPVATCVDLKTCLMKTGLLEEDVNSIRIAEGSSILLTYDISYFDSCTAKKVFVDNPYLTSEVKVGMELCIAQEELILHCTEIVNEKTVKCVVTKGGNLFSMDVVSMRGAKRQRPVLNRRDFHIVKFAVEYQVDIIVVYYVRNGETLKKIKQYIGKKFRKPLLVGGICTQDELDNFDDIAKVLEPNISAKYCKECLHVCVTHGKILSGGMSSRISYQLLGYLVVQLYNKEADAIMICRDFLPFELEASKRFTLSKIQKWLGAKCQTYGKPFIVSGGVFHECLTTGLYTDSEVSDVANALFDGANAFVLKDSPSIDNMLEAIKSLHEVLRHIEPYTQTKSGFWRLIEEAKIPLNAAEAAMLSCAAAANQSQARAIVMPTVTGYTAKALNRLRPACVIITVSTKPNVTKLLNSFRCVVPLFYTGPSYKNWQQSVEARVLFAVEHAVKSGWLVYGDAYVTLQRGAEDCSFCDMVRVWSVAINKKALVECSDDDANSTGSQ